MYRIGICDDDNVFCIQMEKHLEGYAKETGIVIETEVFSSGEDYLRYVGENKPLDILFLDIKLTGMDGVSVGQSIRSDVANETTQIVYVSVEQGYAMSLFKNRPMDFLLKPVRRADIDGIMREYIRLFDRKKLFFEFHVGKTDYRVAANHIMYFQCEGKKIHIMTNDHNDRVFYASMKGVEKQLDTGIFCVIHKSFIININYVAEFRTNEVLMASGVILPISQSMRKRVQQKFIEYCENMVRDKI